MERYRCKACSYIWTTSIKTFCPNCTSNNVEEFPLVSQHASITTEPVNPAKNIPPQQINIQKSESPRGISGPVIKKKLMTGSREIRLHTDGVSYYYPLAIDGDKHYTKYIHQYEFFNFQQITHAKPGNKNDVLQLIQTNYVLLEIKMAEARKWVDLINQQIQSSPLPLEPTKTRVIKPKSKNEIINTRSSRSTPATFF